MPAEVITGLVMVAAMYFILAPRFNVYLYRSLLFFPSRFPSDFAGVPALEGVSGEDVYFKGSMGQTLNAWYFHKGDSDYHILFSHGNSGNLTIRHHLTKLMLRAGYSVFVYDYQGFGRSSGKPTIHGICSDGEAAYDYLVNERGVDPSRIVLYGESLGCAVASYLSTVRACQGLILQSGFSSLVRIACKHFPLLYAYPSALYPKPALDNLTIVKSSRVPILIIHGDLDRVIPVQHAIDLYDAAPGKKHFVRLPGTAHGDVWSTAEKEYLEALRAFPQNFVSASAARES